MTFENCLAVLTKTLTPLALIMVTGTVGAAETSLSQCIAQQDGWIAYQVPMAADAGELCCYEWHSKSPLRTGCDLDGRSWSMSRSDQPSARQDDALKIYVHVVQGHMEKVHAFAASCPIKDTRPVRWLEGVTGADSVAMLAARAA